MLRVPLKKMAKKLVKVSTPMPPTWKRMQIMTCPSGVKVVGMSRVVRPVMQTPLVATKSESM